MKMLNNGGMGGGGGGNGGGGGSGGNSSNGMTTPEGSNGGGMYGGGGPSPSEYSPAPNQNYHPHHHHHHHHQGQHHPQHNPHGGGGPPQQNSGMLGHHSGGVCSQMGLNQNPNCPPNTKMCGGCHGPIMERYLLQSLDRFWHHNCLKCQACSVLLADMGSSCYFRDGMVLCKHDYVKMFGMRGACHGCGQGIPGDELVMRASTSPPGSSPPLVFHMKCFMCSKCGTPLSTGDRYSVLSGSLYCEQDALKLMKNGIGSPAPNVPNMNGPTAGQKKGRVGRPRRSRD